MHHIPGEEKKRLDNDILLGPIRKKFLFISQEAGKAAIFFGSIPNAEESITAYNNVMRTAAEISDMMMEAKQKIEARKKAREEIK